MQCFNKKLIESLSVDELKFLSAFIDALDENGYIDWDKSEDKIYIYDAVLEKFLYRYFNKKSPHYIPDAYINCVTASLNSRAWWHVATYGARGEYGGGFSERQMRKVCIPSGVGEIPGRAFDDCTALEEVRIPGSVHLISEYAFQNCRALKSVQAGANIRACAFANCASLQSLNLHGVGRIDEAAFYKCTSLTDVTISSSSLTIGAFAFEKCPALRRMYLPKSTKSIGNGAFNDCSNLVVETKGARVANMCKKMGVKVKLIESLQLTETRQQTAVKSNGVYSVLRDEWIKEPVAEDIPEINEEEFEKLLKEWEDKYFELLNEVE